MLSVKKAAEPQFLKDYIRKNRPENWSCFTPEIRQQTKNYILENEQEMNEEYFCVYCEKKIDANKSHIEHVKPKASNQFPELFNVYDNFAASCNSKDTCGIKKDNKYDTKFINPIEENPNDFMTYEISTGRIIPKNEGHEDRVRYTCDILNLNGNSELLNARRTILIQLNDYGEQAKDIVDYLTEFQSLIHFYKEEVLDG